ncbi:MAG: hypothetical protein ACRDJE_21665 [Dehalococcoidia bacterium]
MNAALVRPALARVLWIGGAQWSGKTSVAQLLAVRHPLILYAYDYHDARSHADRSRAQPDRYPHRHAAITALDRDPDAMWVTPSPEQMAESALQSFTERFQMVLEDLITLPDGPPVLAEGWGFRPEMVAPLLESPRRAVFLVPTEEYREHQLRTLTRAGQFNTAGVSDPERAQRNRVERDRLLAQDVVDSAERLGLRVIMVDGSQGVAGLVELVEAQFRPYLPRWLYN